MPAPRVYITAQTRRDGVITVFGYVRDIGAGTVTAALPAASPANGAVSKPAGPVTLNPVGEFAHAFTATARGDYDPAVFTATNSDGTHTATSMPMRLYANKTAPVGTPAVLFPTWAPPSFNAATVPLGAEVTTVTLESTSTSDQANVPFTFGQSFKKGDLAPSDFLVGKVAGMADVPLQFNVKATHPDGSVRHALISGVLPALTAGTKKTISMVRAAAGTSTTPATSASIIAAGVAAAVNLTIGGVAYSANPAAAFNAGIAPGGAWIAGAVATEYTASLPLTGPDGAAHPHLTAQFKVRHYPGANATRISVAIEHTKAYTAIDPIPYTGEVRIGGQQAMVIGGATAGSNLSHYPGARWRRVFWRNQANPVHVKHNVPYLLASRQIPNYDQTAVVPETVLAEYANTLATDPNFAPMGRGLFAGDFTAQGGRPELGIAPAWYAAAVLSQDKRAKALMLALAECAGSFGVHRRDTSGGPGTGLPMDVIHFPTSTILGTYADSKNYQTDGYERLPDPSIKPYGPDVSHQSAFAYIPYLVTGDEYYLEELHFWTNWNIFSQNPGYRSYERGLIQAEQVRGQAWTMKTLGQAAAITPDAHPAKPHINYLLDSNLRWYNANYTDNPAANKLGIISHGNAITYNNGDTDKRGIGNFMEDFFTQSMGVVHELGFASATRMLMYKAKWQVSRLIGQGICWIDAILYSPTVRTPAPEGRIYDTIADVMQASALFGRYTNVTEQAKPCSTRGNNIGSGSGYPDSTEGFSANLQPALAYAVDVGYPDADLAWDLFQTRSPKPDYGPSPQFAIVPRGYVAPIDPDPTPTDPTPTDPTPTDPTPPGDIEIMIADNVKDSTTSTGTGDIILAGAAPNLYQTWAAIPINTRAPYTIRHRTLNERENGWGHRSDEFVFVRDEVTSSTNDGQKVAFSAGIKDVECTLTAAQFAELAGKHNTLVSALSTTAPAETLLLVEQNGDLGKIRIADIGQTVMQLGTAPATIPDTYLLEITDPATGLAYKLTYAALKAAFGSTATPADTTAPTMNGTLASSNVTQTAATLTWTAASDAVGVTGYEVSKDGGTTWTAVGNVLTYTFTGLTAGTVYPMRVRAADAAGNKSATPLSLSVTTAASTDTTSPTMSGSLTTASVTSSGYVMNWTAGSDNVAVVAYETSIDGGATWLDVGTALTRTVTGRPASTTDNLRVRARDAAGNYSNVLSATVTTSAAVASPLAITTPSTQQAGVLFTLAGTYTGTAPTALEYSTDGGTTWYAPSTAATIGSNAWSMSVYVNAANAAQTVKVRNAAVTTDVATSAAFTVTAPIAYTVAGYNGNTVKATFDATAKATSGSNKALIASDLETGAYWTATPNPPAYVHIGWSASSTVPPAIIDTTKNTSGQQNGLVYTGKTGANAYGNPGNCWVPAASGTYSRSLWVKPVDGVAVCVGTVSITVA